jgi:glycosyltransferase involved in cell wall biosynthesis
MPAFNEADRIERNLSITTETLSRFGYDFELILVDDGSTDDTASRALRALARHPKTTRVISTRANRGKGNALICGTLHATGDLVAFLDADLDLHPAQLPSLLQILISSNADAVVGSKHHASSHVENYPLTRRLCSKIYYNVVRALFGLPIRDTQTGIKVFKMELLRKVVPLVRSNRFAFDLDVLATAHKLGFRLAEGPINVEFRRLHGRIWLLDVLVMIVDTLTIYYRTRTLMRRGAAARVARNAEPLRGSYELMPAAQKCGNPVQ